MEIKLEKIDFLMKTFTPGLTVFFTSICDIIVQLEIKPKILKRNAGLPFSPRIQLLPIMVFASILWIRQDTRTLVEKLSES